MSTDATVVIKGRNDLGLAVKQAEQQLKGLVKQGELLGKVLRGGAIFGAFMAFERLADSAEKAAREIGDEGTAGAVAALNRQIDEFKRKTLGGFSRLGADLFRTFAGTELDRVTVQIRNLQEQIALLQRQGRSGAGLNAMLGQLRELQEVQRLLQAEDGASRLMRNLAIGRGGGSGVLTRYSSQFDADPVKPPKASGPAFSAESNAYVAQLERMGEATRHFEETLADADKTLTDNFGAALERNLEQLEQIPSVVQEASNEMTVFAEQAGRAMQTAFADFLFDPFEDGLKGMLGGFVDTVRRMVSELMASQLLRMFFEWGSGLGGGVGKFFGSMLPGKAMGGPVYGGRPYMVGEQGPEMFVPGTSGTIIPNHAMGGVTLNYTIDARGADAERIMAILPPMLKRTKDESVAEVRALLARGRM